MCKLVVRCCHTTQFVCLSVHTISEVHGSCFMISDHKIVSCLVDFPSVANHHQQTFCQYHKINVDRLKEDLAASAFVAYPSDDIDTLYEQYVSSLLDLVDMHP